MSSLGVVPDLVASFHADPLRDRSVLLLLLSEEPFDLERLVGGHGENLPPVTTMADRKEEDATRGQRLRRRNQRACAARAANASKVLVHAAATSSGHSEPLP